MRFANTKSKSHNRVTKPRQRQYAYDAANRLTTVSSNGVPFVANAYDAQGRRVRKSTLDATTTFFYDGWNLVEERIAYTNGTTSTVQYFWGKDLSGSLDGTGGIGGLLYLKINDILYMPLYDANGNVTKYLDANGSVVASYTYDAFGNLLSQSDDLANTFAFRFSTKYYDVESSLSYFGKRFYWPVLRRWLNRDPIEEQGGVNLYGFCGNNALVNSDKDGCAYFALRKLKGFIWLGLLSHNPLFDILNIEIAHELVFLGDHGEKGTSGYSNEGVHPESSEDLATMTYYVTDSGYDDCVMGKAIAELSSSFKGHDYSVFWFAGHIKKCNCQDYCSALRRKYAELIQKREVRCKCGIK